MTTLETVLTIILSTKIVATAIVNLTPTPTDDSIVAKVYSFIELLAGIITSKAKGINPELGK